MLYYTHIYYTLYYIIHNDTIPTATEVFKEADDKFFSCVLAKDNHELGDLTHSTMKTGILRIFNRNLYYKIHYIQYLYMCNVDRFSLSV